MTQRYANVFRRGVTALAGVALVAGIAASPASARDKDRDGGAREQTQRTSPFNLGASTTFSMQYNEWTCGLSNVGEVCASSVGSSVGGGGFWPSGTANQYIFNSGLQMAGTINGDTVSTFFFNASGPGAGVGLTPIFASNNPADLAAWPEDCFIDNPVFGRIKAISELDTCVQYWDGDPTAAHFTDSRPMGIQVTQHSMLWSFPNNNDVMFFSYKFKNVSNTPAFLSRNPGTPAGGHTIENLFAAFAMDPDVSGAHYDENYATVVPDLDMAVAWQYDFEADDFVPYAPNFDAAPGFVGVKYLQSPVNTGTEPVRVRVGDRDELIQPGEEFGLTFFSVFTNGGIMSDADNAAQAYRYLSGQLTQAEKDSWCPHGIPGVCYVELQEPDDMRFYQSSGPFSLAPGEEQEIVVAYVAGAPVPGTYVKDQVLPVVNTGGGGLLTDRAVEQTMGRGFDNTAFPSLFQNAQTAQAIYDVDFVLPAPPASPNVTVIPGDNQNTIVWDATPVEQADPFGDLAADPESALYNPDFRKFDFEGFRVYRKSNPSAEFELIAQFDLANAIDEEVTILEQVETADGSILVVSADTASVCNASGCVPNTGLKFAVTDRGGSFPEPSNGPGLINGVRYYYAVTSFDINSPLSGPSSLESARVLSLENSAVPRSTAGGRVAAVVSDPVLIGGGEVLDTDVTVSIDPATGTFSGPQPPTSGLNADFALYDELLVQPGVMSITIDSIVPLNGYEDILGQETQNNANALGVSTAYYFTVATPESTTQIRKEITAPFGHYGAPQTIEEGITNAPLSADAARAQQLGVSSDHFAGAFTAGLEYGPEDLSSGSEAVAAFRAHQIHEEGGSRWFSGDNETLADPTLHTGAGQLPGVDKIINIAEAYQHNALMRWLGVYLQSPLMRAADMEITWGENGTIASVVDLTHNVEIPFHEGYRGSWGIRNDAEISGDGIVSMGDFWFVTPTSEWFCEVEGCHDPLEQQARIQPLSTIPGGGWGDAVASADAQGFGLHIAGELFLFATDALPAAGTKWVLRSYSGEVHKDEETGDYVFDANELRPTPITGLTAQVEVSAPTSFNLAEADLDDVKVVPDPYYVTTILEQTNAEKRLLFTNLPTQANIRIYTLSGVLIAGLQHDDPTGGGTLEWDLRTRNNQFIASGVYFYHIETPNGDERVGKFTVIQYAQ